MHRRRNMSPLLSPALPLRRAQSGLAPSQILTRVQQLSSGLASTSIILAPQPNDRCEIADNKTVTSITSRMGEIPWGSDGHRYPSATASWMEA